MRSASGMPLVVSAIVVLVTACGDDSPATPGPSSSSSSSSTGAAQGTSSSGGASTTTGTGVGTGTTDADGSSSGGPLLPECPSFEAARDLGTITDPDIVETSGLAASRMHPGVLWLHNDSGDSARAFAIETDGTPLGQITIDGALALDWEDMALGPGPEAGVDYLYFGDVGDNLMFRSFVTVYRIPEPDPRQQGGSFIPAGINLQYPDGAHNCEALLSDPDTGDLYLVTKDEAGQSGVYRAAFPQTVGATGELEHVASLTFGATPLQGDPRVTGGDISPDGSLVVLRTYSSVYGWRRAPGSTIAEAFATPPCPLPSADEPGGEAIAYGSAGYYTVSEGEMQPVWFFAAE